MFYNNFKMRIAVASTIFATFPMHHNFSCDNDNVVKLYALYFK